MRIALDLLYSLHILYSLTALAQEKLNLKFTKIEFTEKFAVIFKYLLFGRTYVKSFADKLQTFQMGHTRSIA
jgi:hypothetical protein